MGIWDVQRHAGRQLLCKVDGDTVCALIRWEYGQPNWEDAHGKMGMLYAPWQEKKELLFKTDGDTVCVLIRWEIWLTKLGGCNWKDNGTVHTSTSELLFRVHRNIVCAPWMRWFASTQTQGVLLWADGNAICTLFKREVVVSLGRWGCHMCTDSECSSIGAGLQLSHLMCGYAILSVLCICLGAHFWEYVSEECNIMGMGMHLNHK